MINVKGTTNLGTRLEHIVETVNIDFGRGQIDRMTIQGNWLVLERETDSVCIQLPGNALQRLAALTDFVCQDRTYTELASEVPPAGQPLTSAEFDATL